MFQFDASGLAYQQIDSATLSLYENYADSCTATEIDVYTALSAWTGTTTWYTQPTVGPKYASTTAAMGHAGCPAGTVSFSPGGDGGLEEMVTYLMPGVTP